MEVIGNEQIGKATMSFMRIMRGQPLALALVLMNLVLLTYMFYEMQSVQKSRIEMAKMILDGHREVQNLLSKCIVPNSSVFFIPQVPNSPKWD